jgi:phage terminase large subunit-like protein
MMELTKDKLAEYKQDIVKFAEQQFILADTRKPIVLEEHQKKILRDCFTPDEKGKFPYETVIYSAPKKSGKTCIGALLSVWWSLSQEPDNEIKVVANDLEQSVSRVYKVARKAFELNPNLKRSATITAKQIALTNGTVIDALSCDYAGEAGANQGLTVWDELWGYASENARRLWDELTPVPTRLNSIRFVCTYAGWENESELLWELYKRGLAGKRLYDDLPVYADGDLYMYWDNEPRMPWQTPQYYKKQRANLRTNTYLRLHENRWTSNEDSLFDIQNWDACIDEQHRPLLPAWDIPLSIGVDASVSGDSSAVVATYYDTDKAKIVLALHRKWQPSKREPMDLEETIEKYLLEVWERFRIHVIRYDPYQLHRSAMTLRKKGLPMEEFPQTTGNLTEMGQNLFDLVKHKSIILYPDDDLRRHAQNSMGKETARGWRITKGKASHKVDLIVALAMSALASVETGGASINTEIPRGFPRDDLPGAHPNSLEARLARERQSEICGYRGDPF